MIDTHSHIYSAEFDDDREQVMQRAAEAGVTRIVLPNENMESVARLLNTQERYPQQISLALGLHPEEVRDDWRDVLSAIRPLLTTAGDDDHRAGSTPVIAIGEVGLDFYWSREFMQQQLDAFEEQVRWSAETRLPLMIHCRKAQNEMVAIIKKYAGDLPGGVFHCFTGNDHEAAELLQFPQFALGIGGVLTFKKSHLPEVLATTVPLDRIVLETDAPYMAPVPMRGQRNEPAYIRHVITRMAQAYNVSEQVIASRTTANVARIFGLNI